MSEKELYDSPIDDPSYNPDEGGEFELNRVYVVMPFRKAMDDEYRAVDDACQDLGLRPNRMDESVESGLLLRKIVQDIDRAEFIIFDLTHSRPHVYFALGYAHGVGNEAYDILLIAKEGTEIHFDISPLKVNFYQDIDELQKLISSNLEQMIRMTR